MNKLILVLLLSPLSSLNAMGATRFTARNDTDQTITIVGEQVEATVQPHEEKELCLPCESEITVKGMNNSISKTKMGWHTKLLVAKEVALSKLLVTQHVTRPLTIQKRGDKPDLLITAIARYNHPFDYLEIPYQKENSDPVIANLAANITRLEIRSAVPVESYRPGTPTDRIKLKPMNDYVKDHPDLVVTLENDTDGLLITGGGIFGWEVKQLELAEKGK